MDNNKENVETKSTIREKASTDSNVRTPLVDALRSYFKKERELLDEQLNYDMYNLGLPNA